jgi:hypothetical protein
MADYKIVPMKEGGLGVSIESIRAGSRGGLDTTGTILIFRTTSEIEQFVKAAIAQGYSVEGRQLLSAGRYGLSSRPLPPLSELRIRPLPGTPQSEIFSAIEVLKRKRGSVVDPCPRCNTDDWNADILQIPSTSLLAMAQSPIPMGSGFLSLLGLVCKNCGYTVFHNLDVLGISKGAGI